MGHERAVILQIHGKEDTGEGTRDGGWVERGWGDAVGYVIARFPPPRLKEEAGGPGS